MNNGKFVLSTIIAIFIVLSISLLFMQSNGFDEKHYGEISHGQSKSECYGEIKNVVSKYTNEYIRNEDIDSRDMHILSECLKVSGYDDFGFALNTTPHQSQIILFKNLRNKLLILEDYYLYKYSESRGSLEFLEPLVYMCSTKKQVSNAIDKLVFSKYLTARWAGLNLMYLYGKNYTGKFRGYNDRAGWVFPALDKRIDYEMLKDKSCIDNITKQNIDHYNSNYRWWDIRITSRNIHGNGYTENMYPLVEKLNINELNFEGIIDEKYDGNSYGLVYKDAKYTIFNFVRYGSPVGLWVATSYENLALTLDSTFARDAIRCDGFLYLLIFDSDYSSNSILKFNLSTGLFIRTESFPYLYKPTLSCQNLTVKASGAYFGVQTEPDGKLVNVIEKQRVK